jgi:hypothetical protein
VFPRWANRTRTVLAVLVGVGPIYLGALGTYALGPESTDLSYMPVQPVPNSHALHVGQLGMDCRFCHHAVEVAAHATLPHADTCQTCHRAVRSTSPKLHALRRALGTGPPLRWTKVNDLPDYVVFDHRAHVTRGVACVLCHGPVDRMEQIWQTATLSMAFCLDCHRDPAPWLRPLDQVTSMNYQPAADGAAFAHQLSPGYGIRPMTDCSTCHR